MIHTAESVSSYHVDKIADQISDAIVDHCITQDKHSRVAVETLIGHNEVHLIGEITTKAELTKATYELIVIHVLNELGLYNRRNEPRIYINIVNQSPDIAKGVDKGGAGDQGIMIGYACNENEAYIPQELYLAREILKPFKTDAKSQVTIDEDRVEDIVLSVQGKTQKQLESYLKEIYPKTRIYCNNTGSFDVGGWEADSGGTGRKLVVDAYGPRVPIGGGAFSGKDPTKVDRSAAYMARFIALDLLNRYGFNEVLVKLGYVIGGDKPLMQVAIVKGQEVRLNYDCRPQAIIERLGLLRPIYYDTARYGHFGLGINSWDRLETTPPPQKAG